MFRFKEAFLAKYKGKAIAGIKEGGKIFLKIMPCFCIFFSMPCMAQKQHGKASYYSKKITGARTASGQKLHHDSLTCAHRFYPFGTMLKVTNLSNKKSVIVKVTDRGPYGRGRIIDLSWGAAKAIGMLSQGVATVKVEMIDKPIPYRPEDPKLPHIDFEVAESDYDFPQKWNHKEKLESKPHQHGAESGKKEHLNKHQKDIKEEQQEHKNKIGNFSEHKYKTGNFAEHKHNSEHKHNTEQKHKTEHYQSKEGNKTKK